jgi:hypothetical protein
MSASLPLTSQERTCDGPSRVVRDGPKRDINLIEKPNSRSIATDGTKNEVR